jgi:hypothetical protein
MAFGQKDKSKLTKKVITDKTGKKTTVWVKPDGKESVADKMKKEVTFTKETYDPKNKHHWAKAVSDLSTEVKNAKTPQAKKEAGNKLNEAVKQGQKHGHISSNDQEALKKINEEHEERTGKRMWMNANGMSSLQSSDQMAIDGVMSILDTGVQALVGGTKERSLVR